MSNHYHLVLHIDEKQAKAWTHQEIVTRWATLHHTPPLIVRWQKNELTCDAEIDKTIEIIEQWRERLMSLSWFMRNMNEYIARQANQEDQCTGRFWEGRFKSQALLSERALLSCMAYVDLNPIRATMADSLENSEYTSIFEHIHSRAAKTTPYKDKTVKHS